MILPELDEPVRLEPPVGLPSNLWIREKPLHSIRNSEKEFERFLASLQSYPKQSRILLIGGGALFERLTPLSESQSLVLYEPILALRNLYSERTPLPLAGPSIDLQAFDVVLVNPAYRRLLPSLNGLSAKPTHTVDRKTTKHFLRLWTRNYGIALQAPSLTFFKGFEPHPSTIVFCGAGPTLRQDLRAIKRQLLPDEHPVVLVADTAAAAVLHAGWHIDLVISVDSGFGTSFHLSLLKQTAKQAGVPLPAVLTWLAGSAYMAKAGFRSLYVPTLFPPDQILSAHLPLGTPFSNPFRNVLGYAVALQARHAGSRLLLAGVGFESQGMQFYTSGTGYDHYYRPQQDRLHSLEGYHVTLAQRQVEANRSAVARLGAARRLEAQSNVTAVGRPEIQTSIYEGKQLRSVLGNSDLERRLQQEFGDDWALSCRRHLAFSD